MGPGYQSAFQRVISPRICSSVYVAPYFAIMYFAMPLHAAACEQPQFVMRVGFPGLPQQKSQVNEPVIFFQRSSAAESEIFVERSICPHFLSAVMGSSKLTPNSVAYSGVPEGISVLIKSWTASPVFGFCCVFVLMVGNSLIFVPYPGRTGCSPAARSMGPNTLKSPLSLLLVKNEGLKFESWRAGDRTPKSECRLKICHWLKIMRRATKTSVHVRMGEGVSVAGVCFCPFVLFVMVSLVYP